MSRVYVKSSSDLATVKVLKITDETALDQIVQLAGQKLIGATFAPRGVTRVRQQLRIFKLLAHRPGALGLRNGPCRAAALAPPPRGAGVSYLGGGSGPPRSWSELPRGGVWTP